MLPGGCRVCSDHPVDAASESNLHGGNAPALSNSAHKSPTKKPKSGFKPPSAIFRRAPQEQNVFWHASQTKEPPVNFTPGGVSNCSIPLPSMPNADSFIKLKLGLISVLKKALTRSHEKGFTQRAWLASEHAVHISSELWDSSWGCGYVHCQSLCAHS